MNFTSWLPYHPVSFHLGCSLFLAVAHIQTHLEGCFVDLSLIKVTVKNNCSTYIAKAAQPPAAALGSRAGESLGNKRSLKEPSLSQGQEGKRKQVSQDCVELAGDSTTFENYAGNQWVLEYM